jgi:transcription elongation GreA/GreB family factor
MQIPRRQWSRRPPPNYEPVYLTPEGVRRLKARLARLKASLPDVIAETARTSACGDRSDNAEYKEAKGILRRTHGQIFHIEDQLRRIVLISNSKSAAGTVQMGSTVKMVLIKDGTAFGAPKTFRILGPSETDPPHGRISHISPLGAALMRHTAGDIVAVQTPKGPVEYQIISID